MWRVLAFWRAPAVVAWRSWGLIRPRRNDERVGFRGRWWAAVVQVRGRRNGQCAPSPSYRRRPVPSAACGGAMGWRPALGCPAVDASGGRELDLGASPE